MTEISDKYDESICKHCNGFGDSVRFCDRCSGSGGHPVPHYSGLDRVEREAAIKRAVESLEKQWKIRIKNERKQ